MTPRTVRCDVCLGTEFESYLQTRPCGRTLERCRGCGLVMAMRGGGGRSDGAVPASLRDRRADLRRAAAVMKILPSGTVLEVGSGEGFFLSALDPGRYEVVGVEASADAAALAVRRIADAGLRGGLRQGSLLDVALPAETFDLIAIFGSLGSAGSPRAICMEIARLLRTGGIAVIETPSLSSITALLCGSRWRPLRDPHADYFFTPACLETLLSSCGLAPGVPRMAVPVGWPSPGNLVYVTRKSSVVSRATSLTDLASNVGSIAPMGAAH